MNEQYFFGKLRGGFSRLGIATLLFFVAPFTAHAEWNVPSCNPDEVGPTHPSCNVSAPVNVSSAQQTKTGQLEIQNTLSAAQLEVSSGIAGGDGSVSIDFTGNTADAVLINTQGTDTTGVRIAGSNGASVGLDVSGTTTGINVSGSAVGISADGTTGPAGVFTSATAVKEPVVDVTNSGVSGEGVHIQLNGAPDPTAVALPSSGNWKDSGVALRATTAGTMAIAGYAESGDAYSTGVYGAASQGYGVVGHSANSYGIYANTDNSSVYGSLSCNQEGNCAFLGGATYAALLTGRTYIKETAANQPVLLVENLSTSSSTPGYGIRARTKVTQLTPYSVPQGTAIEGQAVNGNGVFGYSQNNPGVRAVSTNGNAIYATSGAKSAVYAVAGSAEAVYGKSTSGLGVLGESDQSIGVKGTGTTGVRAEGSGSAGVGVSGAGEQLAGQFDGRVEADQFVETQQSYTPFETVSVSLNPLSASEDFSNVRSVKFDGSEIWLQTNPSNQDMKIFRIDPQSLQISTQISLSSVGVVSELTPMVRSGVVGMFFWNQAGEIYKYQKNYTDPQKITGSGDQRMPNASVGLDVGNSLYVGTSDGSGLFVTNSSNPVSYQLIGYSSGTWGNIVDLSIKKESNEIYALNQLASADDEVVFYDINAGNIDQTYVLPSGKNAQHMVNDGKYLWVTMDGGGTDSVARVNPETGTVDEFFLTENGLSGGVVACSGPSGISFDGVHIWVACGDNDRLVRVLPSSGQLVRVNPTQYHIPFSSGSPVGDLVFDGSYMWAPSSFYTLYKFNTGMGDGSYGRPWAVKNFNMYSPNGTIFCVNVNNSGTIYTSSGSCTSF